MIGHSTLVSGALVVGMLSIMFLGGQWTERITGSIDKLTEVFGGLKTEVDALKSSTVEVRTMTDAHRVKLEELDRRIRHD